MTERTEQAATTGKPLRKGQTVGRGTVVTARQDDTRHNLEKALTTRKSGGSSASQE